MRVVIVGIIVLALAVTAVTVFLIQSFSTPDAIEEIEAARAPVQPRVLVATRPLVRGDVLIRDALRWQFWPENSISPNYVVVERDEQESERLEEYLGTRVRQPIEIGEPILPSKVFKTGDTSVMAGILEPGMRAVSVPVAGTSASGGFVLPGDFVDVMVVHTKANTALQALNPEGFSGAALDDEGDLFVLTHAAETILRNIKVLAVDAAVNKGEGITAGGRSMTLELTPKQAEIVTIAQAFGTLSVVLRPMGMTEPEELLTTFTTDVEVSPLLQNIEEIMAGKRDSVMQAELDALRQQKELQEQIAREQAIALEELEAELAQGASQPAPTPAPAPSAASAPQVSEPSRVITIYRGGANSTQELSAASDSGGAQ